jgi:dissimilatory sulfite reductase (desulfoviridin) alpha/beta subunit
MFSGTLYVNGVSEMTVKHDLVAKPGVTLADIKTVISHPQALGQCRGFIRKHGFDEREYKNTALAAEYVRDTEDKTVAAIASAEAAEKFGHSYVHLTSRQGVEIPFIRLEEIDEVKDFLAASGVQPGVCGPRVRTVTACQGGRCCPSGCIDALEIAEELDRRYFGRQLPHKFKFGVTGCQNNCLKAEENDLGVKGGMVIDWNREDCIFCGVCEKACRRGAITIADGEIRVAPDQCNHCGRCVTACPTGAWKGSEGFLVSFGGTFGNDIQKGREILPIIRDRETLLRVADAAIDYFDENARAGERFAKTLERLGWESFTEKVLNAYNS